MNQSQKTFLKESAVRLSGLVVKTMLAVGNTIDIVFRIKINQVVSLIPISITSRLPTSSNYPNEAPTSEKIMYIRSTVLSEITGGMGSYMAQNI